MRELTLRQIQSNPEFFYSEEFWTDSDLIEKYCNSIMSDHGFKTKVIIAFDETNAFVTKDHINNNHKIRIPTISFKNKTQEEIEEQILHRSVFLRHELSHILYSDFNVLKQENQHKIVSKFLLNCLEDVRIEKKFANKYRGSADAFYKLHEYFFNKNRNIIETSKPTVDYLGLYFISRAYGATFALNKTTAIYEEVYQKNKFFYTLDFPDLLSLSNSIADEFNLKLIREARKEANKFENLDLQKSSAESKQKKSSEEKQDSIDESDSEDSSPREKSKKLIDKILESKKEETQDSPNVSQDEEDIDSTVEQSGAQQSQKIESNKKPIEFSDFVRQEMKEQKDEDLADAIEEISTELSEIQNNFDNSKKTLEEKLAELGKKLSEAQEKTNNEEEVDRYYKSAFKRGMIIPYDEIIKAFPFNLKQQLNGVYGVTKMDKQYSPLAIYKAAVQKNNTVIQDAVSYLKLKFQGKEKIKNIGNKEDGLLDSYNLSKIFANDNNVFYKKFESIVEKSNVILMLDYSGSMSGSIREAIQSIIVFHEILKRIDMPHAIYVFTSPGELRFLTHHPSEKEIITAKTIFKKYGIEELFDVSTGGIRWGIQYDYDVGRKIERSIDFDDTSCLYQIRQIDERNPELTEKILGFLYSLGKHSPINMGETPEPNCVYALYKKFNHLKNKKFIFVNDGEYNSNVQFGNLNAAVGSKKKNEISDHIGHLFDNAVDELLSVIFNKKNITLEIDDRTRIAINNKFISEVKSVVKHASSAVKHDINSYKIKLKNVFSTGRNTQKNKKIIERKIARDAKVLIANKIEQILVDIQNKLLAAEKSSLDKDFAFSIPGLYFSSKSVGNGKVTFACEKNDFVEKALSPDDYALVKGSPIISSILSEKNVSDSVTHIGMFQYLFYEEKTLDGDSRDKKKIGKINKSMDNAKHGIIKIARSYELENSYGDITTTLRPDRHQFNLFYKRLFSEMRKNGWYICGFGICCADGVEYIGEKYFQVLESAADISSNFSKKLRKII